MSQSKTQSETTDGKNSQPKEYDILIVGCGPVGASLANLLSLYGHRVAIFDMHEEVFYAPRAYGIDDECVRTVQTLGLLDRMYEREDICQSEAWIDNGAGRRLATFNVSELGEEHFLKGSGLYYLNAFDQPRFEEMLRSEFANHDTPVDAWLGYEVTRFADDGDSVSLTAKNGETGEELTFVAQYLIGADGANSIVKSAVSPDVTDLGYIEHYLVLDTIVDDDNYFFNEVPNAGYIVLDPKHAGVVVRGLHNQVRFDFLLHHEFNAKDEEDYKRIGAEHIRMRGYDPDKFRVIRHAPYTFRSQTPNTWRKGRLMLAGDAAHLTPPWSGQGLNMGMRDVGNLACKLDLVLKERAPASVLDSYTHERMNASLETISGAVDMGRRMTTTNPLKVAFRNLVFLAARHSRRVLSKVWHDWQRKPSYKNGLIGKNHKLAGTLMPQPELTRPDGTRALMDDMIGLNFALVTDHSAYGPAIAEFAAKLGGKVFNLMEHYRDPDEALLKWFRENDAKAVLVRSDRYIFDAGNDGNALCAALLDSLK